MESAAVLEQHDLRSFELHTIIPLQKLGQKMNKYPIAEYFNRIPVFASAALSDDGSTLAYVSSLTGSPQVWLGTIAANSDLMLYPKPLTSNKDSQPHVMTAGLMWVGPDRLACLMDSHGDEQTYIEIWNLKDSSTVRVPKESSARDFLGFVSSDKKTLYFTSNRNNPKSQGLYAFDLRSKKVKRLYHHEDQSSSWIENQTHNGNFLFYRAHAAQSNTLHALNPKTGKVIDLFTELNTQISPVGTDKKNNLLVVSNHGRQFLSLAIFDIDSKKPKYLEPDKWDIELAEISPDKKHLLIVRNCAGKSEMELYSLPLTSKGLKKQTVKFSQRGVIESLSFSKNSQFAVFAYSSPTEPRNFYRLNLRTREARQLTDNWTARIPKSEFVYPKLITYKSQNRKNYSWLFLPKRAKKNKSLPVLVWPHGGPQWQEKAQFRPLFQYFIGRGFVIWAPNPTGSTGFGRDFANAICGQWGTADLPDMENGIEWLKQSGWIDPSKIGIIGGSYGGYMTLRSITKISNTFKAAVDIFGVSNLFTFIESVPPDWRPYMSEVVGNPEIDKEKLEEQSPVFALDKIECPLLVIQGAKDPRVVKAESDQVVERLKAANKTVDYLVFDDEGHGFLKLENELRAYTAAANFLERWMMET